MTEEEIKHRFIWLLATYLDHPSIYMEGPTQRNKRRAGEVYDMLDDAGLTLVQWAPKEPLKSDPLTPNRDEIYVVPAAWKGGKE